MRVHHEEGVATTSAPSRAFALVRVQAKLAARLARDGDPESLAFEETDTTFQIAWPGAYRVEVSRRQCAAPSQSFADQI